MPESANQTNRLKGTALCFDYGSRHIGVAVGQTLTCTASPLGVIKNHQQAVNWNEIGKYISEWKPAIIIVGLPLNMDGSKSDFCSRAERFSRQLNGRYELPVALVDERLSTYEAKNREAESGKNRKKSFGEDPVDSLAAQCILETWLAAASQQQQ